MEANKVIITGGATRIGGAISRKLSGPGVEIVIHYNESKLDAEKLKKELSKNKTKVYLVKGDLSKETDVKKIVKFAKSKLTKGENNSSFKLPHTGAEITYKILDGHDESKIEAELRGIKKINKNASPELSTRLKHMLLSVNGDSERKIIREFVDNYLLAIDSRALREHIRDTQPDIDLTVELDSGEEVTVPIGINFFWPDA